MTVHINFPHLETDRLLFKMLGMRGLTLFINISATKKYVNFYMMKKSLQLEMKL